MTRYLLPIDAGRRFVPALPEQRAEALAALVQALRPCVGTCRECRLPGVVRVRLRLQREGLDLSDRRVCLQCLRDRFGITLTDDEQEKLTR